MDRATDCPVKRKHPPDSDSSDDENLAVIQCFKTPAKSADKSYDDESYDYKSYDVGHDDETLEYIARFLASYSSALQDTTRNNKPIVDAQDVVSKVESDVAGFLASRCSAGTVPRVGRPPGSMNKHRSAAQRDASANSWVLGNVRNFMQQLSTMCSTGGNIPAPLQQAKDVLSLVLMGTQVPPPGLTNAIRRVTGFSRSMVEKGSRLASVGFSTPQAIASGGRVVKLSRAPHSRGQRTKQDWKWVYDWFHHECPDVHLDKDRNIKLNGGRSVFINGKKLKVVCQKRVAYKTKEELTKAFFDSRKYKEWEQRNPAQSMGFSTVRRLICPCISAATVKECVCRFCTEFTYALKAWHTQRGPWQENDGPCPCPGCSDPTRFKVCVHYTRAAHAATCSTATITHAHTHAHRFCALSASVQELRRLSLCPKQSYKELILPDEPGNVPQFYALKCCAYSKKPKHVSPCTKCGIAKTLLQAWPFEAKLALSHTHMHIHTPLCIQIRQLYRALGHSGIRQMAPVAGLGSGCIRQKRRNGHAAGVCREKGHSTAVTGPYFQARPGIQLPHVGAQDDSASRCVQTAHPEQN